MPSNPPLQIKVTITEEHLGLYNMLKISSNRGKLTAQLAMLGAHVTNGSANGPPIGVSPHVAQVETPPETPKKRRSVSFSGSGEDF